MEDKNIKRAKIMKECREKKGLTLQKVSDLLKKYNTSVSSATLQRYETGEISRIPLNRINALAEIYGTTPSHLLALETTPTSQKPRVDTSMLTEAELEEFNKITGVNQQLFFNGVENDHDMDVFKEAVLNIILANRKKG